MFHFFCLTLVSIKKFLCFRGTFAAFFIKQLAFTIKSSAKISPLGSRLSRGKTSLISSLVAISDFMQFEIEPEIHLYYIPYGVMEKYFYQILQELLIETLLFHPSDPAVHRKIKYEILKKFCNKLKPFYPELPCAI
jgi:hypothetical protein